MNNPDCNSNVCTKDGYGNVTANKQDGNDIRNEHHYKGHTIDIGISCIVWKPDNKWLGKFPNLDAAKSAIDSAIIMSK